MELALRRCARRDKDQCRLKDRERRLKYDGDAVREDDAEDQNDGRKVREVVTPVISCKTARNRTDKKHEANQKDDRTIR
jgi:hypothetical protein